GPRRGRPPGRVAAGREGRADPVRPRRQPAGGGVRPRPPRRPGPGRPHPPPLPRPMSPPGHATLTVLAPGLHTLVVDAGRPGWRGLGVPLGGAADRFALAIGNALVGNHPDAAALEVTLAGPTLVADAPLACVLYGAPFEVATDRRPLTAGTTFTLGAD